MKSFTDNMPYPPQATINRFTPRELIRFHIEHPEIPITDTDIENLIFDVPGPRYRGEGNHAFEQKNNLNINNSTATILR